MCSAAARQTPPLSLQAVKADPAFWNDRIDTLMRENPGMDRKELSWTVYKEVIRRGAAMFRPMWDASDGRYGWVSGQLDPRLFTEREIMVPAGRPDCRYRAQRDGESSGQLRGRGRGAHT